MGLRRDEGFKRFLSVCPGIGLHYCACAIEKHVCTVSVSVVAGCRLVHVCACVPWCWHGSWQGGGALPGGLALSPPPPPGGLAVRIQGAPPRITHRSTPGWGGHACCLLGATWGIYALSLTLVCVGGLSLVPPLVGSAVGFPPRSCPGVPSELAGRVGAGGGGGKEERMGMSQGQDRSGTSDPQGMGGWGGLQLVEAHGSVSGWPSGLRRQTQGVYLRGSWWRRSASPQGGWGGHS